MNEKILNYDFLDEEEEKLLSEKHERYERFYELIEGIELSETFNLKSFRAIQRSCNNTYVEYCHKDKDFKYFFEKYCFQYWITRIKDEVEDYQDEVIRFIVTVYSLFTELEFSANNKAIFLIASDCIFHPKNFTRCPEFFVDLFDPKIKWYGEGNTALSDRDKYSIEVLDKLNEKTHNLLLKLMEYLICMSKI